MGICLGMQLLFERSFEYGEHRGLGLIKGDIMGFDGKIDKSLKIPQIGWNQVDGGTDYYFVHSYYAETGPWTAGKTSYCGIDFTSVVRKDRLVAYQFHPEKSGRAGLKLLEEFVKC